MFSILAKARRLRGTPLDPFRTLPDRLLDDRILEHYEADVRGIAVSRAREEKVSRLDADRYCHFMLLLFPSVCYIIVIRSRLICFVFFLFLADVDTDIKTNLNRTSTIVLAPLPTTPTPCIRCKRLFWSCCSCRNMYGGSAMCEKRVGRKFLVGERP